MDNLDTQIKSLVFAEDDEDDRSNFKDIIQEDFPDIDVHLADNGLQLLGILNNIIPDAVFIDLDMPYKNGLECLVEIRNNPTFRQLPVIVISSTSRPANIQAAYEMGASLFLVKSPLFSEFAESLKKIIVMDWSEPTKNHRASLLEQPLPAL